MQLSLRLGNQEDLRWAQETVARRHYLERKVDWRARPMAYILTLMGDRVGVIMAGIPHATRNQGWWGYPGLITQWQVVDLCRIWLDPRIQAGGEWCNETLVPGFIDRQGVFRPTAASWAIEQVLGRIQRDRVSLWPPVFPEQPYHIRLVISYHDPVWHRGTIYRVMGWEPMYWLWKDEAQTVKLPVHGPSGKFGWCRRLPEPGWSWDEISIIQPRTMRLVGV